MKRWGGKEGRYKMSSVKAKATIEMKSVPSWREAGTWSVTIYLLIWQIGIGIMHPIIRPAMIYALSEKTRRAKWCNLNSAATQRMAIPNSVQLPKHCDASLLLLAALSSSTCACATDRSSGKDAYWMNSHWMDAVMLSVMQAVKQGTSARAHLYLETLFLQL